MATKSPAIGKKTGRKTAPKSRAKRPKGASFTSHGLDRDVWKLTSKGKIVTIGSWKVRADPLSVDEAKSRVAASNTALKRMKWSLATSGVHLARRKGVPLYHADPEHPDFLIRELDGRRERGLLIDGKFRAAE
jgi:hypothetical protein